MGPKVRAKLACTSRAGLASLMLLIGLTVSQTTGDIGTFGGSAYIA